MKYNNQLEKMKKELQIIAEADEATVKFLANTNVSQELQDKIACGLEKMREEFDELENEYYELKAKARGGEK